MGSVFGDEFLIPLKKTPFAKNVTLDTVEQSSPASQNADESKLSKKELSDIKKSEKDIKDKEKDSQSPKNAQNAHEAIRPAETDGKVRTVKIVCISTCAHF